MSRYGVCSTFLHGLALCTLAIKSDLPLFSPVPPYSRRRFGTTSLPPAPPFLSFYRSSTPRRITLSESNVMATLHRPRLNRCGYVIGPQSTGKTTLVNALVDKFKGNVHVIKEVARSVMNEKGYSRKDIDCGDRERKFSFQNDIFLAQLEEEERLKSKFYISDRSAIDPLVYLTHYSGESEARRITSVDQWKSCRAHYSNTEKSLIILLLPVERLLADDNVRYMAGSIEEWKDLGEAFYRFLQAPRNSLSADWGGIDWSGRACKITLEWVGPQDWRF